MTSFCAGLHKRTRPTENRLFHAFLTLCGNFAYFLGKNGQKTCKINGLAGFTSGFWLCYNVSARSAV
jgi:hypothetical protein